MTDFVRATKDINEVVEVLTEGYGYHRLEGNANDGITVECSYNERLGKHRIHFDIALTESGIKYTVTQLGYPDIFELQKIQMLIQQNIDYFTNRLIFP